MTDHLIKLAVGCDTIHDLHAWQEAHRYEFHGKAANIIVTRHTPKQSASLIKNGGSVYRVIKGFITCRQKILGFDTLQTEEGSKCLIYTDTTIIRTALIPRRAFQGWRYLKAEDTPEDAGVYQVGMQQDSLELQAELRAVGLL